MIADRGVRVFDGTKNVHRLLALILPAIYLVACTPRPAAVRPPEEFEKQIFEKVSASYCQTHVWPKTVEELQPILTEPVGHTTIPNLSDVQISTPRAILFTMEYTAEGVGPRRVTFIAPPSCSPDPTDDTVAMAGGRVSFRLSRTFELLDGEGIKERWKSGPYPDAAWEQLESKVVVAVRFGEAEITAENLPKMKSALERSFSKSVKGLKWLRRDYFDSPPIPRVVHEFFSDSSKGRLTTIAISLSFDGRLLSINVAGPADQRAPIDDVADTILSSLSLS